MSQRGTVLVTGASSGIGAELARQLAVRGYDLALCARRTDRLEALRAEILAGRPDARVEVSTLDVTDEDQVFEVFRGFRDDFGTLERIVVNAGLGKGARIGTGGHAANRETAMTNFIGALAQTEAAMEIFRDQGAGHLVMISSMAAVRGLPGTTTTYAATKAAVAHLVEGLRVEFHGKPQRFTVIYPGYIASEMNDQVDGQTPLMASTERGVRSIVAAIEAKKSEAYVPQLPWLPLSVVMRHLPAPVFKRMV